ncbi:MAG: FkbM family methyltransferase, partial [Hyphomicrobium sp.]
MVRDDVNARDLVPAAPPRDLDQPRRQQLVHDLTALYDRLASGTLRDGDVVPLDLAATDGSPRFLRDGIESGIINQADARVFKHFTLDDGVILDVGAHWGYMAMSILNSGTDCPVLSIEAIPSNFHCLDVLHSIAANFDFVSAAVSDKAREVVFYNPVVNGMPLGGVNSIDGSALRSWHVPGTVDAIEKYAGATLASGPAKLQLGAFTTKTQTLDSLLANRTFRFPVDRIAAIKIDAEGHDYAVLTGALQTIRRDKPLLLVESSREPAIVNFMTAEGYVLAQRNDDHLTPLRGDRSGFNEFFIHSSRAAQYAAAGLLRVKIHITSGRQGGREVGTSEADLLRTLAAKSHSFHTLVDRPDEADAVLIADIFFDHRFWRVLAKPLVWRNIHRTYLYCEKA